MGVQRCLWQLETLHQYRKYLQLLNQDCRTSRVLHQPRMRQPSFQDPQNWSAQVQVRNFKHIFCCHFSPFHFRIWILAPLWTGECCWGAGVLGIRYLIQQV